VDEAEGFLRVGGGDQRDALGQVRAGLKGRQATLGNGALLARALFREGALEERLF
jgi:hypothetical protein